MSHFESAACCHRLLKRLPEIQWRLPYWPKGYMSLIPPGLFFIENDWTPSHAIAEIKRHIMRLLHLDLSTAQAFYLSQKIVRNSRISIAFLNSPQPSLVSNTFNN